MAFVPLCTCAPWAGEPVASTSTHIRPFSPKRTTLGEPTSPQMLASPAACGYVLEQVARAQRAHVLLVAGQGQHDLAVPGVAVLRQQQGGQQRAGDAALHVADAAAVELAVLQHPAQRRHGPGRFSRSGKVSRWPLKIRRRPGPRHGCDRPGETMRGSGSTRSISMPGISRSRASATCADVERVARRVGRGDSDQALRDFDQAIERGRRPCARVRPARIRRRHQRACSLRSQKRMAMASGQQMKK
jgi:hypothetical protein